MRIPAALLIGTSVFAFAVPASAQTGQEAAAQAANPPQLAQASGADIIVTATKRASRVQDVPFSINAQTQADIQRANAQTSFPFPSARIQQSFRAPPPPTNNPGQRSVE